MTDLKKITTHVYFYIGVFALINLIAAIIFVSPGYVIGSGDAGSYHEAIKFLEGLPFNGPLPLNRLLTTPLLLFLASLLDHLVRNAFASLAIINFFFYILIGVVFYELALAVYRNKRAALFGTILFISNYYLFNIDNFFIADLGGRFFFLIGNLFAVKYFLSREKRHFYLAIGSAAVGILFKEFGVLGLISLLFLIALSDLSWRERLKQSAQAIGLFVIIPLLFHLFFFLKFGFSYLDWYGRNVTFYPSAVRQYGLVLFIKVMGWIFLAGWPLWLWGLWQEKKFFDQKRLKILAGLLPASLTFFAWPIFMERTAFVLVPWLSLIAGFGLAKIKNRYWLALLVLIYLAVNYSLEYLLVWINLPF